MEESSIGRWFESGSKDVKTFFFSLPFFLFQGKGSAVTFGLMLNRYADKVFAM